MNGKLIVILAIFALINAKNLRFLDNPNSPNVVEDAMTMVGLMKDAGAGGFTGCMGHIGMIIDAAYTVFTTFSNRVEEHLERIRTPSGLKTFMGSVVYDFTLGFREKGYDFFAQETREWLQVPETFHDQFVATLEEGSYTDKSCLGDFNFAYRKPGKNNVLSYINMMIYHYRDANKDKFDAIITTAEAEVELTDVEYIWHKSKSYAGGIKVVAEDYSEYHPRDMTDEDVQNILMFFQVASYKELAKIFGIKFDIVL